MINPGREAEKERNGMTDRKIARQEEREWGDDCLNVQTELVKLLAKKTERYTGGESSSVPMETAQKLLYSVCFTLGVDFSGSSLDLDRLDGKNLTREYAQGLSRIEEKIQWGKDLWETARLTAPAIENISLRDTLESIGGFWKRYDYTYFAHEIPCDIDYQLCHPVPETQFGIDYINQYLSRLIIENDFIRRFPLAQELGLLEQYCPDYRGLLINLYEPIATNALGLTLLAEDVYQLDVSPWQARKLWSMFSSLSQKDLLRKGAETLCSQLQLAPGASWDYLKDLGANLAPRIDALLETGTLEGVFLSFGVNRNFFTF